MATTSTPTALPTTEASAVRRPCARARPTTNSTLGPGITMRTRDARANASNWPVDTMTGTIALPVAEQHQRQQLEAHVRGRHRGHLGVVVGRGDLDDVGAHHREAGQAAQDAEQFP